MKRAMPGGKQVMSEVLCVQALLFGVLLVALLAIVPAGACSPSQEAAVWATPLSGGSTTIWYAEKNGTDWAAPSLLSLQKGLHVTPVIALDNNHVIWIVWVEQTKDENILRYAQINTGHAVTGRVTTWESEQSYAPAIVIDAQGKPLIAWSAVVEQYADIYWSSWNGSTWERPGQVNRKNESPDITPFMGLHGDVPWVSWLGVTAGHRYVQFQAHLLHNRWDIDKSTLPSINIKKFISHRSSIDKQLPGQAAKRLMGAVFSRSGGEIQSLTERFVQFQPAKRTR